MVTERLFIIAIYTTKGAPYRYTTFSYFSSCRHC